MRPFSWPSQRQGHGRLPIAEFHPRHSHSFTSTVQIAGTGECSWRVACEAAARYLFSVDPPSTKQNLVSCAVTERPSKCTTRGDAKGDVVSGWGSGGAPSHRAGLLRGTIARGRMPPMLEQVEGSGDDHRPPAHKRPQPRIQCFVNRSGSEKAAALIKGRRNAGLPRSEPHTGSDADDRDQHSPGEEYRNTGLSGLGTT